MNQLFLGYKETAYKQQDNQSKRNGRTGNGKHTAYFPGGKIGIACFRCFTRYLSGWFFPKTLQVRPHRLKKYFWYEAHEQEPSSHHSFWPLFDAVTVSFGQTQSSAGTGKVKGKKLPGLASSTTPTTEGFWAKQGFSATIANGAFEVQRESAIAYTLLINDWWRSSGRLLFCW